MAHSNGQSLFCPTVSDLRDQIKADAGERAVNCYQKDESLDNSFGFPSTSPGIRKIAKSVWRSSSSTQVVIGLGLMECQRGRSPSAHIGDLRQIGRASCRERV